MPSVQQELDQILAELSDAIKPMASHAAFLLLALRETVNRIGSDILKEVDSFSSQASGDVPSPSVVPPTAPGEASSVPSATPSVPSPTPPTPSGVLSQQGEASPPAPPGEQIVSSVESPPPPVA